MLPGGRHNAGLIFHLHHNDSVFLTIHFPNVRHQGGKSFCIGVPGLLAEIREGGIGHPVEIHPMDKIFALFHLRTLKAG